MFKSRFIKPSSVQPFKPCLMNVALEYIRKKKKNREWIWSRVFKNAASALPLKMQLQQYKMRLQGWSIAAFSKHGYSSMVEPRFS